MAVALWLSAVLVCVFLVQTGWTGRRIGHAPHCLRCGYDLSGLSLGKVPCPECGGKLLTKALIRYGERRRQWGRCAAGGLGLLVCVSMVTTPLSGWLSVQGLVRALPTETLIKRTIERPIGLIDSDGRWELSQRLTRGSLNAPQQQYLSEALQRVVPGAGPRDMHRLVWLLSDLAVAPGTSGQVKADLAGFLCELWYEEEQAWGSAWTRALIDLHDGGFVPSEDWDALLLDAVTPRVWCNASEPLLPGEEFLVGCRFRSRGIISLPGLFRVELDLPEGFRVEERLLEGYSDAVEVYGYLSESTLMPTMSVKAGAVPGQYSITVRVLSAMDKLKGNSFDKFIEQGSSYPGGVVIEQSVPVVVAAPDPVETNPGVEDLAEKLRRGVLPALWNSEMSGASGKRWFGLSVPIRGRFWCSGRLVAIEGDGGRVTLGTFYVSSSGSRWSSKHGSSSSGGGYLTGAFTDSITTISVYVEDKYAHPAPTAKLVLAFDRLRWTDGTEYEGPMPFEVEIPLDRINGQPAW